MPLKIDVTKLGAELKPRWFTHELQGEKVRFKLKFLKAKETRHAGRDADTDETHIVDTPELKAHWLSAVLEIHPDDLEIDGGPGIDNPHVQQWMSEMWDLDAAFSTQIVANASGMENFQGEPVDAPAGTAPVDEGAA